MFVWYITLPTYQIWKKLCPRRRRKHIDWTIIHNWNVDIARSHFVKKKPRAFPPVQARKKVSKKEILSHARKERKKESILPRYISLFHFHFVFFVEIYKHAIISFYYPLCGKILAHFSSLQHTFFFWIRKNGLPVPGYVSEPSRGARRIFFFFLKNYRKHMRECEWCCVILSLRQCFVVFGMLGVGFFRAFSSSSCGKIKCP